MTKGNKASHLLSLQSKELLKLKRKGQIEDFRHMELEKMLGEFYNLQGKSERIKNFPFPRQYATVNFIFVWIFLILLPFGMLNVFSDTTHLHSSWLALPFTLLVSWVFILMEMIGEYSENPFEGLHNDVPISTMARSIEIDIRQMLDENDLPKPLEPAGEHNIMY
jgi:putative membrane protein